MKIGCTFITLALFMWAGCTNEPERPSTPELTAQSRYGVAEVLLEWTPAQGAVAYRIYRSQSPSGEAVTHETLPALGLLEQITVSSGITVGTNKLRYYDEAVSLGTRYAYRVSAVNAERQLSRASNPAAILAGEGEGNRAPSRGRPTSP